MVGRVFLGRYEALRVLGEGGMGLVYLARQLDLGRHVVVKVMHDEVAADPKFRERFQRETLLMARFQHPFAVTLHDASLDDPQGPCIVMEYIRGVTLDTLLQNNNRRLNPARVGRLLGQLCEVLQAAHTQGIIHRDLKPANLMIVDPDTPYEKIKVMDFGLAKLHGPKKSTVTENEFAVGTPAYMCPEQVRGDQVDHRGDLYSVGVILYELLTGRLPFAGLSDMEMLLAHATELPPPFADVGAGETVPSAIEAVVRSCLAKDPAQRPLNARDLAERYETALAHEQVMQDRELPSVSRSAPERTQPSGPLRVVDPRAVIHYLEAWMPATIAAYKLRGFVEDAGGKVVENVPGLIRVHLGSPGSLYSAQSGPLTWLGLGRKAGMVELELRLQAGEGERGNRLSITVLMRSLSGKSPTDPCWRERCDQIYCDLRAYLIGQTGSVDAGVR